ncbi:MAG: response regulator [Butyrivibrio sp.]|nr:response regulator [Butyrivibrio sp.]
MKRIKLFNFFTKRNQVDLVLIVVASVLTVLYTYVSLDAGARHSVLVNLLMIFKYVPIMLTTALGGIIPGMICVVLVFIGGSVISGSIMYSAFVYLMVACAADIFTKTGFYKKIGKVFAASAILQLLVGDLWGFFSLLLEGKNVSDFEPGKLIPMFFVELPGCLLACVLLHVLFKTVPDEIKLLCGNGMYYVDSTNLDEDDRYVVEGKSKIGNVVMMIIVFEAFVLGIIAEIASNGLNADMTMQRSVELAMLISIIITPLSIFVNTYAQYRIAEPIRNLAKAVTDIYNSEDIDLNGSVEGVHRLRIATNDEIEDLYHAIDLTLYRFMEYIELVRSRKMIEDQLRVEKSANEAKSRFLSNMSHEIRTPINAVLGFDELILRECEDENILSYAMDIQSSGKTLLALINDILDFSKIEAGKMEIIPLEYGTCSMLNDVINMIEMKAEEKGLEFVTNIAEDVPSVLYGDETRIKQCIMNLLTNAVKYTHTGTVTMVVYKKDYEPISEDDSFDERIVLGVRIIDTGIGIREEDIDKLTYAFERIDEKKNRTIEGTGLGINIVTSILNMMDSKLNVKSEYGRGSEFSFEIVQTVVNNEPIGDFSKNYRLSKINRKRYRENFHAPKAKILVVDDVKTNLTVIQGLLKKTLISVDTALSGREALDLVKSNKYDVIFLDHRMPDLDGIQTLHMMQDMAANMNKKTPVVALTANAVSGSREMYFKEGFSNYLSKPVSPAKLEEMIVNYLPSYKVSVPGDKDFGEYEGEDAKGEGGSVLELLKANGTDVDGAIARCGSEEVLIEVMKDFRLAIKERSELIEKYAKEKDLKNFAVYVHGLKSSARAIGATELSEKAEYLEKCADENNQSEVDDKTPELLELYRSYLDKLSVVSDDTGESDTGKPTISEAELEEAFSSMKEFVSASYFDSADDIMNMLKDYRIPDKYAAKYDDVKRLMAAVDRDGLLNIL